MNGEIITMYIPIFREKLARLEELGRGNSAEATRLRKAISWVDSAGDDAPENEKAAA